MTSPKISNEMIYELLKETREDMHDFKSDMREFRRDVYRRFDEIDKKFDKMEANIEDLHQNKIKWNAGLIGGVVAMSSIASIILIRLLHLIGIKVVALSQIIFV